MNTDSDARVSDVVERRQKTLKSISILRDENENLRHKLSLAQEDIQELIGVIEQLEDQLELGDAVSSPRPTRPTPERERLVSRLERMPKNRATGRGGRGGDAKESRIYVPEARERAADSYGETQAAG